MAEEPKSFPLLSIDPATKAAAERVRRRDHCACLSGKAKKGRPLAPDLHGESQDEAVAGWSHVKTLIERAKLERSSVFEPSAHIAWEEWMRVITLPPELGTLSDVTVVRTYASHLRRLPPEIGRMSGLAELDVYTSYSLHWLPYEVTRCTNLRSSRMSTRALYGNRNTRLPFPRLSAPIDALQPTTCSVCDRPFERTPRLLWITLRVATDTVPLLVHSCSKECTLSLPRPPDGYFERPHQGGGGVGMPDEGYGPFGILHGGERVLRPVKNWQTGEDETVWCTVHVNRETREVIYVPDKKA